MPVFLLPTDEIGKHGCWLIMEPWKMQYFTSVHVNNIAGVEPRGFNIVMAAAIYPRLRRKHCHGVPFLNLLCIYVTDKALRIAAQLYRRLLEDKIYCYNLIDYKSSLSVRSNTPRMRILMLSSESEVLEELC